MSNGVKWMMYWLAGSSWGRKISSHVGLEESFHRGGYTLIHSKGLQMNEMYECSFIQGRTIVIIRNVGQTFQTVDSVIDFYP